MISDAVYTFAKALTQNETFLSEFRTKPTRCEPYYEAQEENPNSQIILDNINNVIALIEIALILEIRKNTRNTIHLDENQWANRANKFRPRWIAEHILH